MDKDIPSTDWAGIEKVILHFAGCTVFALLMAVILHELGHAFMVWWVEGLPVRIALNPFTGAVAAHAEGKAGLMLVEHVRFIVAGGPLFGSLSALLLYGVVLRCRINYWTVPVAFIALVALAANGIMLVVGLFLRNVGDVARLREAGVPGPIIAAAGIFLLVLGFLIFPRVAPWIGMGAGQPYRRRAAVMLGGLLPYSAAVLGYNWIHQPGKLVFYLIYILAGWGVGLAGAGVIGYWQGRNVSRESRPGQAAELLDWPPAIFAVGLAIGLIVLLFVTGAADGMP